VDQLAGEIRQAQPREQARWGVSPRGGSYQAEIGMMKRWLSNRVDFIDTNFVARPVLDRAAGPYTPGVAVPLRGQPAPRSTSPWTAATRDNPAAASPQRDAVHAAHHAQCQRAPVARARNPSHQNVHGTSGNPPLTTPWSGPVAATYGDSAHARHYRDHVPPRATPAGDTNDVENFAFVELKNTASIPLSLIGCRFTGASSTLGLRQRRDQPAAGAYAVLVRNRPAFQSRYPQVTNIAGEYAAALITPANGCAVGPLENPSRTSRSTPSGNPRPTGWASLVLADENLRSSAWGNPAAWRRSSAPGGSPDAQTAAGRIPPVLVNEALTHTDPPVLTRSSCSIRTLPRSASPAGS
jgi:hypothetical protein